MRAFCDIAYWHIVQGRLSQGDSLGNALEKTARYAARTLRRGETQQERDALAIARRNTQAMKALGGLLGGQGSGLSG